MTALAAKMNSREGAVFWQYLSTMWPLLVWVRSPGDERRQLSFRCTLLDRRQAMLTPNLCIAYTHRQTIIGSHPSKKWASKNTYTHSLSIDWSICCCCCSPLFLFSSNGTLHPQSKCVFHEWLHFYYYFNFSPSSKRRPTNTTTTTNVQSVRQTDQQGS